MLFVLWALQSFPSFIKAGALCHYIPTDIYTRDRGKKINDPPFWIPPYGSIIIILF